MLRFSWFFTCLLIWDCTPGSLNVILWASMENVDFFLFSQRLTLLCLESSLDSDLFMCGLVVSSGVHTKLNGISFFGSFLSRSSLIHSCSQGDPFMALWGETQDLVWLLCHKFPVTACASGTKLQMKSNGDPSAVLLGPQFLWLEGEFPPLRALGSYLNHRITWRLGQERKTMKKNQTMISPTLSDPHGASFPLLIQ